MIRTLRKGLARILRGLARRVDATGIDRLQGHACTDPFFWSLVQIGFKPRNVVDVGANRGSWSRTAMRYFPEAQFTLFEPQGELLQGSDLEGNVRARIFAMGAGPRTSTMKLSKHERDDSFSFALSEDEAARQGREQVEAPVVALDEFLRQQEIPYPDMLKIDAEGWDLEVLKGAEKCVVTAEIVLLEAAVMNKSFDNNFVRVVLEMESRGFVVFDITDLNRTPKTNALWLVEVAFVKKGGKLDNAISNYM